MTNCQSIEIVEEKGELYQRECIERLTHGDADEAYDDLDDGNGNQGVLYTALDEPVIGEKRQDEAKDVLEDDHEGETFNGEISYTGLLVFDVRYWWLIMT